MLVNYWYTWLLMASKFAAIVAIVCLVIGIVCLVIAMKIAKPRVLAAVGGVMVSVALFAVMSGGICKTKAAAIESGSKIEAVDIYNPAGIGKE